MRVDPGHLKHKLSVSAVSRPVKAACKMMTKLTQCTVPSTVYLSTLWLPWLWFFCDFSSAAKQMQGYNVKRGHGTPSLSSARHGSCNEVSVHHQWLPSCDYATLGSKPQQLHKVWPPPPPKKKLCFSWALVFSMPSWGLQPRQEIISISTIPSYIIRCVLLWPAMQ